MFGEDSLNFVVKAETKGAEKDIKNLKKDIDGLNNSMKDSGPAAKNIDKAVTDINQNVKTLVDLQKSVVGQQEAQSKAIQDTATELKKAKFAESLFNISLATSAAAVGFLAIRSRTEGLAKSFLTLNKGLKNFTTFGLKVTGSFLKGFEFLGGSLGKTAVSFIKLAEVGALATVPLIGLGATLKSLDSEFLNLIGNVVTFSGVLLGSYSAAILGALKLTARFISNLGEGLLSRLEVFVQKFAVYESVVNNFEFTIRGFNRVIGDSVGSLDSWNQSIDKFVQNTKFSRSALSKSAKLLVAEGSRINLSFKQTNKLLDAATEIASSSGIELERATQAIISGLVGQSRSLLGLGVDVREAAIGYTDLAKSVEDTGGTLTEQQKVLLRYKNIIEQTAPAVGAAANTLTTLKGSAEQLEKSLEEIEALLGKGTFFTAFVQDTGVRLAKVFLGLPKPVIVASGTLLEMLGIVLKVGGSLLLVIANVALLHTGFSILNGIVASSVAVQATLTTAVNTANAALGLQAVTITSLGSLFVSLGAIIKASVIKSLFLLRVALFAALKAAILLMLKLTPFLALIGALSLASVGLYNAFVEIVSPMLTWGDASEDVGESLVKVNKETEGLMDLLKGGLLDAVSSSIVFFTNLGRVLIGKVASGILNISKAYLMLKTLFADPVEAIGLEETIAGLTKEINKIEKIVSSGASGLSDLFGGTAQAQVAETRNKILEVADDFNKSFADAGKNSVKATAEEIKSALNLISQENRNLTNTLKNVGASAIQTIRNNLSSTLKTISLREKELELSGKLTDEIKKQIGSQRSLNALIANAQISEARLQATNNILEANSQLKSQFEEIGKTQIELVDIRLSRQIEEIENTRKRLDLEGLLTDKSKKGLEDQIVLAKQLAVAKKQDIQKEAEKKGSKKENKTSLFSPEQIKGVNDIFGKGAESVASAANQMTGGIMQMGQLILGLQSAVSGLLDMPMQIVDGFTKIIDQLTNFGTNFANSILNLLGSMGDFVKNFASNLIKGVESILDGVVDFITELPNMIIEGISNLDEMLTRLIDRLPDIAERLVVALVESGPKISLSILKFLVLRAPVIAFELVKNLSIMLPKALIKGLEAAFNMLGDIFSGDFSFLDGMDEKAQELEKSLGKRFVGVRDSLFGLVGEDAGARASTLQKSIVKGAQDAVDLLEMWASKIGAWGEKIWHGFLGAIGDVVAWFKDKGEMIWDGLIEAIGDITETFEEWGEKIWDGLTAAIGDITETFEEWGEKIWDGFTGVVGGLTKAFEDMGGYIWDGFTGIVGGLTKAFKDMGGYIWDGLTGATTNLANTLKNWGGNIWEGLEKSIKWPEFKRPPWMDELGKQIDKLTGSSGGGDGVTAEAGNKIADGFNKIFGTNFNQGGMVSGMASVAGDNKLNDKIMAMLSPGEYVVKRTALKDPVNLAVIKAINDNNLKLSEFNQGGMATSNVIPMRTPIPVSSRSSRNDAGSTTTVTNHFSIKIEVKGGEGLTEQSIKTKIVPAMIKELQKKSRAGQYVIDQKGVRA